MHRYDYFSQGVTWSVFHTSPFRGDREGTKREYQDAFGGFYVIYKGYERKGDYMKIPVHNLIEAKALIKEWNATGFNCVDIEFVSHDGIYICTATWDQSKMIHVISTNL